MKKRRKMGEKGQFLPVRQAGFSDWKKFKSLQ
jgi:hypothetical protein